MPSYEDPARGANIARFIGARAALKSSKVLDIGCNTGAISIGIARKARSVTSGDMDNVNLRVFSSRKRPANLSLMKFDALSLPVKDGSFDLVVINGVLEHVPMGKKGDPEESQMKLLRNAYGALKKGGMLYFAIENRFSIKYLAGSKSHNGMRFIDFLPRKIANAYSRAVKGKEFRQYTHSMGKYRRMLASAGFSKAEFFMAVPNYQFPEEIVSIEDGRGIVQKVDMHAGKALYRAGMRMMTAAGLQKTLATNFVMLAKK